MNTKCSSVSVGCIAVTTSVVCELTSSTSREANNRTTTERPKASKSQESQTSKASASTRVHVSTIRLSVVLRYQYDVVLSNLVWLLAGHGTNWEVGELPPDQRAG